MRKAILMLVLAALSSAANTATLWKCTNASGVVLYTNQGAERVTVIACRPTNIINSETGSPEKKYSCSVKFENGRESDTRNIITDRDGTGRTQTCTILSQQSSEVAQVETAKGKAANAGSVNSHRSGRWVSVSKNEKTTFYTNPSTIRKVGNRAKMWSLLDFETAQGLSGTEYLSVKAQNEFDCKDEQHRILFSSFHSKNMSEGEVVFSISNAGKWEPVPPESVTEGLWKLACGKK